ncbi:hypothetical protein DIE09_00405 [Burkholderia sp. Bp9010]|nr:hypothetical protein DIE09_00405 [Burkholderia sp. Bp9010]
MLGAARAGPMRRRAGGRASLSDERPEKESATAAAGRAVVAMPTRAHPARVIAAFMPAWRGCACDGVTHMQAEVATRRDG